MGSASSSKSKSSSWSLQSRPDLIRSLSEEDVKFAWRRVAGHKYWGRHDAKGRSARFKIPAGVCVNRNDDLIIADTGNHSIRIIFQEGDVATVAGSYEPGMRNGKKGAKFRTPRGVCCDQEGNVIVADAGNNLIRWIDRVGNVHTIAGSGEDGFRDGKCLEAQFSCPKSVIILPDGRILVADSQNHCIRQIYMGKVSTLCGRPSISGCENGSLLAATFNCPQDIVRFGLHDILIADCDNHVIRRADLKNGMVSNYAGMPGGIGMSCGHRTQTARFFYPLGLAVDAIDNVIVCDAHNGLIRMIEHSSENVLTLLPTGDKKKSKDIAFGTSACVRWRGDKKASAFLDCPYDVAVDKLGNIYVVDSNNHGIYCATAACVGTQQLSLAITNGFMRLEQADGFSFVPTVLVDTIIAYLLIPMTRSFRVCYRARPKDDNDDNDDNDNDIDNDDDDIKDVDFKNGDDVREGHRSMENLKMSSNGAQSLDPINCPAASGVHGLDRSDELR